MAKTDNALAVAGPLTKTIAFAVAGALILGLLFMEFGEIRLYDRTTYSAVVSTASGIQPAANVTANGVKIGKIDDVTVVEGDKARIDFTIDGARTLTDTTHATIRYQNLTGDQYLDLAPGAGGVPLEPGGTIPIERTTPSLDLDVLLGGFDPLFQGLQPEEINKLTSELITVLQGQGGTLESLFSRAASLSGSLADQDQLIGQVVDNFNGVLGSLDRNSEQLSSTLGKAQEIVGTLTADRQLLVDGLSSTADAARTLSEVTNGIRSGRAALDQLGAAAGAFHDQRDELDRILTLMPGAYLRLGRVSTAGAGYSIFLCSLQFRLTGADGQPFLTPLIGPATEGLDRCRQEDNMPLENQQPGSDYPYGSAQEALEEAGMPEGGDQISEQVVGPLDQAPGGGGR